VPETTSIPASVTFIGNATTVLRLGDFTLMTDPNFVPAGARVHLGYGAWTRRVHDPAWSLADLPARDGVLLSHLHEDHFDRMVGAELSHGTPIFTTPQAQHRLRRWRFQAVQGLPTWETYDWTRGRQQLHLTASPRCATSSTAPPASTDWPGCARSLAGTPCPRRSVTRPRRMSTPRRRPHE
jgi:L-ascorbate metabolism protein UlaG (beta-lactamase superfamily)